MLLIGFFGTRVHNECVETYIRIKVVQWFKRSPARGGERQDLFWNTVHYIKQLDKTSILIKFLNTLIV